MRSKFLPHVTLIVKGLKAADTRVGTLPAGTVCVRTVASGRVLPPGLVAVRAVKRRGARANAFGDLVIETITLAQDGTIPPGCALVDAVSLARRGLRAALALEAVSVLKGKGAGMVIKRAIRVPEIPPPVIGVPKRRGGKFGIRVPVVPPKIKTKR